MTEVSPQQNIPRWDPNYICLELHKNGTSNEQYIYIDIIEDI